MQDDFLLGRWFELCSPIVAGFIGLDRSRQFSISGDMHADFHLPFHCGSLRLGHRRQECRQRQCMAIGEVHVCCIAFVIHETDEGGLRLCRLCPGVA